MKKNVITAPSPKGIELPSGNCTLTLIKKVDPATLHKRLRAIYQKLLKGAAKLSSVAGENRHKRWSVRILLKMKLVKAEAEVRTRRRKLRTFSLRFVPHLPAVEFAVRARSAEEAARKAEKQIRTGKGPVVEAIRDRLVDELIAYVGKKPSLAPCPCKLT